MNRKERIKALLENQFKGLPVPFLVGAPGSGKTAFFEALAKDNGWDFIVVPSQSPPEDFVGIPERKKESFVYLPNDIINKMINPGKKTLFLFDELNMSYPKSMVALYQLFNERRWNNMKLSEDTMLAATGNLGAEDDCGSVVEEMPAALRERLITIKWDMPLSEWMVWAKEQFGQSHIFDFLSAEPRYFDSSELRDEYGAPSARGWTHLLKMSQLMDLDYEFVRGVVGVEAATAYVSFCDTLTKYTWDNILKHPELLDKIDGTKVSYVVASLVERLNVPKKITKKEAKLILQLLEVSPVDLAASVIELLADMDEEYVTNVRMESREFNGGDNAYRRLLKKVMGLSS